MISAAVVRSLATIETTASEAQKNIIFTVLLRGGVMRGQTRKQMLDATIGSLYIWPFANTTFYAVGLATALGRGDLKIIPLSDLDRVDRFRGIAISGVTLDHACFGRISDRKLHTMDYIQSQVGKLKV